MMSNLEGPSTRVLHEQDHERLDRSTRFLRVSGALLLLAGASSFMLQRWGLGSDTLKYGFLLAHTVLVVLAGIVTSAKLKEARSARVFLWLALAILPTNFAVLGGLVYSQFALDHAALSLPNYAHWVASRPWEVGVALLLTFMVAASAAWLAFRALLRKTANSAMLVYLALLSSLLIPLRDPDFMGPIAAVVGILTWYLDRRLLSQDPAAHTLEGRLARIPFLAPSLFLASRTILFYEPTATLLAGILLLAGISLFSSGAAEGTSQKYIKSAEIWGALLSGLAVSWLCLELGFPARLSALGMLPSALALLALALKARLARQQVLAMAGVSTLVFHTLWLVGNWGLLEAGSALAVGILITALSFLFGNAILIVLGGLVGALGAAAAFEIAIGFHRFLNWGALSGLGVALVLGAAMIERHRGALLRGLRRFQEGRLRLDQGPLAEPSE